ncbi:S4 domain-containing protein [Chitinilyticum piscinae]|uniref:Dual-specificity RNA pseudouridine synthase RluF n=1 Tax=Chitinilyticum piscinae TaxID=2866724 RepID=A0A8J7KD50_9NEIS|nr:S4 domain-containing protein [Chitinilyticum piscinae]MBE9608439.1 rRNA pseudouridine synthase [Chitinilyticum piscinae]
MDHETLRLSKYMAELGLCSRSEADRLIETGRVMVDGKVVDTLGSRVKRGQKVTLSEEVRQNQPDSVTLILNKPAGIDMAGEKWLDEARPLLGKSRQSPSDQSGIYPLRRHLDQQHLPAALAEAATGLVVLTQDKHLADRIRKDCELEYLLWVEEAVTPEQISKLEKTARFREVPLKGFKASRQSEQQIRIVLRNPPALWLGELAEAAGLTLTAVKRIRIGRLALGPLESGKWRYVGSSERI